MAYVGRNMYVEFCKKANLCAFVVFFIHWMHNASSFESKAWLTHQNSFWLLDDTQWKEVFHYHVWVLALSVGAASCSAAPAAGPAAAALVSLRQSVLPAGPRRVVVQAADGLLLPSVRENTLNEIKNKPITLNAHMQLQNITQTDTNIPLPLSFFLYIYIYICSGRPRKLDHFLNWTIALESDR